MDLCFHNHFFTFRTYGYGKILNFWFRECSGFQDPVSFRIYGSGIVPDWCVRNNEFVFVLLKLVNNNYIGSRFCSVLLGIIFKLYLVFGSTIIVGFVVFCSKLYLNLTLQLIPKDKDDQWLWKCRTVPFSNFRSRVMLEFLKLWGCRKKNMGCRKKKPYFYRDWWIMFWALQSVINKAVSSCTSVPSCATPISFLYSKNTLF